MSINRRELMASAAASALLVQVGDRLAVSAANAAEPKGWQTLPLGAGGYICGMDIALDGTKVIRTDTYGAYRWNGSEWVQLITFASLPGAQSVDAQDKGVSELRIAPSNSSRLYMNFADVGLHRYGNYQMYRSDDKGASWIPLSLKMTKAHPNEGPYRLANQKMAVDPANPDIIYVGAPPGAAVNGATPGKDAGIYRSFNAGATWEKVADIGTPLATPGPAGFCFDARSGTVTVGGQTRTKRLILPGGGLGIWETKDGGQTFTKIANPTSPPVDVECTTSQRNSVVIVSVNNGVTTTSVTATGPDGGAVAVGTRLANQHQGNVYLGEYFFVAPTPGTYKITINSSGSGRGVTVATFAITGADVSSPPASIFDGNAVFGNAFAPPTKAVSAGTAMVFEAAQIQAPRTTPDTGWTLLQQAQNYIEYIVTGPGSYKPTANGGNFWGGIIDAVKQAPGGKLAIDGALTSARGGVASAPGNVWTAQMDADGTYWCVNSPIGTWRYFGGRNGTGTWSKMDGKGGLPANYPNTGGQAICVDPRVGHEGRVIINGPNGGMAGFTTTNGNSPDASTVRFAGGTYWGKLPTWTAAEDEPVWLTESSDFKVYCSVGDMMIDPVDGKTYLAFGAGVGYFTQQDYRGLPFYNVAFTIISKGIEQLVAHDVCAPPGGRYAICAVEDKELFQTRPPLYPKTYWVPYDDRHAYGLDYASSDPRYVLGIVFHVYGRSSYSDNYGQDGSWHQLKKEPLSIEGGSCAMATPDNAVVVRRDGLPVFTKELRGACNWAPCGGLPNVSGYNNGNQWTRSHSVAADRVDIGTYYVILNGGGQPNAGIYRSTDFGATFRKVSNQTVLNGHGGPVFLLPVPGRAGHLWLSGNGNASNSAEYALLYRSTDHGVTWSQIKNVTGVGLLALGKESAPGGYPTIFVSGKVNGANGFFRSTDEGATWTVFGRWPQDLPTTCQLDFPVCMSGDWNKFGTVYIGMNGSGYAYFSL